jgi:hypothetical protein
MRTDFRLSHSGRWRRVANSTVEFSGSRLRNAAPHPEQI